MCFRRWVKEIHGLGPWAVRLMVKAKAKGYAYEGLYRNRVGGSVLILEVLQAWIFADYMNPDHRQNVRMTALTFLKKGAIVTTDIISSIRSTRSIVLLVLVPPVGSSFIITLTMVVAVIIIIIVIRRIAAGPAPPNPRLSSKYGFQTSSYGIQVLALFDLLKHLFCNGLTLTCKLRAQSRECVCLDAMCRAIVYVQRPACF